MLYELSTNGKGPLASRLTRELHRRASLARYDPQLMEELTSLAPNWCPSSDEQATLICCQHCSQTYLIVRWWHEARRMLVHRGQCQCTPPSCQQVLPHGLFEQLTPMSLREALHHDVSSSPWIEGKDLDPGETVYLRISW
jgi:hypothetical protein